MTKSVLIQCRVTPQEAKRFDDFIQHLGLARSQALRALITTARLEPVDAVILTGDPLLIPEDSSEYTTQPAA